MKIRFYELYKLLRLVSQPEIRKEDNLGPNIKCKAGSTPSPVFLFFKLTSWSENIELGVVGQELLSSCSSQIIIQIFHNFQLIEFRIKISA